MLEERVQDAADPERRLELRASGVSGVHLTGGRKAARTGMFECCAGDGKHVARACTVCCRR
jgi:hypothetical protein